MAVLRIQTGPKSGTLVPIKETNLTIGRGGKVVLQVPDEGASRQHAEIFRMGELHFIRDLTSRNGTYVNDLRVGEAVLRDGDQVRVGDTVLLFLESEASPQARPIRLERVPATNEAVRFRDTMAGPPPSDRNEVRRSLPRRVSQIIAGESDVGAALGQIVREVAQALGGDRADVLLIESEEPEIRFRSVATFDTRGEGEIAVSRTIFNEVVERQEAILSSDAPADDRFGGAESIITSGIRSVICVPILVGGSTAGVLYLCDSHRPDSFDREDLEVAAQIGGELGAVLGMARILATREEILREALHLVVGVAGGQAEAESAATVGRYARAVAHSLGLGPEEVTRAWVAGILHRVAAASREKRKGSREGAARELLAEIPGMEGVIEAVECQDERHDGSGSPEGRQGEGIPLLGRILSLAKELDRLTRAGEQKGRSPEKALASLRKTAGKKFHPEVVRACLVAHRNGTLCAGADAFHLGI